MMTRLGPVLAVTMVLGSLLGTAIGRWQTAIEERDSYKALAYAERQRYDEVIGKAGTALATCVVKP